MIHLCVVKNKKGNWEITTSDYAYKIEYRGWMSYSPEYLQQMAAAQAQEQLRGSLLDQQARYTGGLFGGIFGGL